MQPAYPRDIGGDPDDVLFAPLVLRHPGNHVGFVGSSPVDLEVDRMLWQNRRRIRQQEGVDFGATSDFKAVADEWQEGLGHPILVSQVLGRPARDMHVYLGVATALIVDVRNPDPLDLLPDPQSVKSSPNRLVAAPEFSFLVVAPEFGFPDPTEPDDLPCCGGVLFEEGK